MQFFPLQISLMHAKLYQLFYMKGKERKNVARHKNEKN